MPRLYLYAPLWSCLRAVHPHFRTFDWASFYLTCICCCWIAKKLVQAGKREDLLLVYLFFFFCFLFAFTFQTNSCVCYESFKVKIMQLLKWRDIPGIKICRCTDSCVFAVLIKFDWSWKKNNWKLKKLRLLDRRRP